MKLIIKLFPEIMVKSDSVKTRFIKILTSNIRNILQKKDTTVAVIRHWDYIEVNNKDKLKQTTILQELQKIPGIHHILVVEESIFTDLNDIFLQTFDKVKSELEGKTFSVRVKRQGIHNFTSLDVERYVGGGLNQNISTAKVKLQNPDVEIKLSINNNKLLLITDRYQGIGGFPVGTQNDVLSLISGGFDSGVASYMFIRRGCKTHYCFFNLGGDIHEIGVKQMAYHIWKEYGSSHKVKFITIDFAKVVEEILTKIDTGLMGVILKRMMVRSASMIAKKIKVPAIVTGEALGQVSSQTLDNLQVIDKASDTLVLRPLITHDKELIIKLATDIGTANIAKTMPEYCGVISKKPTVKAIISEVLNNESKFNFAILEQAVNEAKCIDIRTIEQEASNSYIEVNAEEGTTFSLSGNDVIIDIRSEEDIEKKPLLIENVSIINIPFFKLMTKFSELDRNKNYLLYCEHGTMSKIQALYLKQAGYNNIKIFNHKIN